MTDRNSEGVSIELLPLPDELRYRYGYMGQAEHDATVGNYARANVAHATAAKDADIEALRESLDWTVKQNDRLLDEGRELTARADRLQAELDNRWAQGVHTCHDKCQRIACVLLRDNKRLAEALRDLLSRAPGGYECGDFHHSKDHRHGPLDACPPMQRWHAALDDARAALRDHDKEGKE